MDDFSARSQDPNFQAMRRQTDQIPTWTQQSSQYPDIPTVYSTQQTSMYQNQNQPYGSYRNPQVLPSIHDSQPRSEKISNGMETNRSMAMSSYPPVQGYGQTAINRMDLQNGAFDSRRAPSYYDQAQRHPQNYPQVTRHNSSNIEYQNPYQPRYDLYRPHSSYGGPYTDMEYSGQPAPVPQPSNFNMVGENVDSRGKRRRGNLPKPVTDILRAWFHEHLDHPYPTEEDKQQFMQRTGLTLNQVRDLVYIYVLKSTTDMKQISNWFINARRRQLPSLRQNRDRLQHRDRTDRYRSQESSIEPR